MLHSMTGFARESVETDLGTLTWEIRAVNHRYLDVQLKLPEDLRPKEQAFRQQASAVLGRGKVECGLYFRRATDAQSEMQLDTNLIDLLGARLSEIAARLPQAGPVNPLDILRWPGVTQQPEIDAKPLFEEATALLEQTLAEMNKMRLSEGQRMKDLLEARCVEIDSIANAVRKRMPEVLKATRSKQKERIDKLDIEADPARLELELAMIAQKIDVDEELDRLDSHLVEIRDTLVDDKPVGRRLDF